jgi:hypothetical protein
MLSDDECDALWKLPTDEQVALAEAGDVDICEELALGSKDRDVQSAIAGHPDRDVRIKLVHNRQLSPEAILLLAHDPDEAIRSLVFLPLQQWFDNVDEFVRQAGDPSDPVFVAVMVEPKRGLPFDERLALAQGAGLEGLSALLQYCDLTEAAQVLALGTADAAAAYSQWMVSKALA